MSIAEGELIRIRQSDGDAATSRAAPASDGAGSGRLARTKKVGTYPTAANSYFACETQGIGGDPSEGGAASLTGLGDTILVYNIGTALPAIGTLVGVDEAGDRAVMQYDG